MYTTITIISTIACALLGMIVIIQTPQGNLHKSFGELQLVGVRRSGQVVERLTWSLALAIISLCLSGAHFV